MGIGQRQFEGGTGSAGEDHPHDGIAVREDGVGCPLVIVRAGQDVAQRQLDLVEDDRTLVQCPLPELVQRLASADTLSVEGHDDGAALFGVWAVARVGGTIADADLGDGAVGDPVRLAAVDDYLVVVQFRHAVGATVGALGIEDLLVEIEHIGTVFWLGGPQQPISDSGVRSSRHWLPNLAAVSRGSIEAPNEIANPASLQPSSSNTRQSILAICSGSNSSTRSTPRPSWPKSLNTLHSGEFSAIISSGVIRSSCWPIGRITSAAKRCTLSCTSCSSRVSGGSAPVSCRLP